MGISNYLKLALILPLFVFNSLSANTKYYVHFVGKKSTDNAEKSISPKAVEKRYRLNIQFDERDLPVNRDYISTLQNDGVAVLSCSKWLNTAIIDVPDNINILKYKFINSIYTIRDVKSKVHKKGISSVEACTEELTDADSTFINTYAQFHIMNGEYLHSLGFNGENMTIVICDAGFNNVNNMGCFSPIFAEGRMKGTFDYVNNDSTLFSTSDHTHGTMCFSTIGGLISDKYQGGATQSDFYLFQTENGATERILEEYNLARALERCDSLGVDVVSISLGYTTFDVSTEDHDSLDMMRNNTPAAKAVNTAVSKGLLVCVAAGNEGNSSWHYISTPADADSAIAVAAVDLSGNAASFSGWGLAQDTRVKPNVACVGSGTAVISTSNNVVYGSGTSFACPSLAGFATCLWQAFPTKTPWQIKTAIEQSASLYTNPNKRVGYGIPDFKKAYEILQQERPSSNNKKLEDLFLFYPIPVKDNFTIKALSDLKMNKLTLVDFSGKVIYKDELNTFEEVLPLQNLSSGIYFLRLETDKGYLIKKIIKQ